MRLTPAFDDLSCDRLRDAVFGVLDARLDRASPAPVALGLSGGGDSLALLRLAAAWCAGAGRPLLALTVDHGLHPHGAAWTRAAGAMARAAGADWRALAWRGPRPAAGLPAAARAARHRLLAQAAREAGAHVILLAHTADDAVEADRMRDLIPGLGRMRAWAPSPAWPQGRGLGLLRPLLEARRRDLRVWLAERGLAWVDDPANADPSHPRIRARHALAGAGEPRPLPRPLPPIDADADAWGIVRLPRAALRALPAEDGRRLLAAALACAAGAETPARGATVERLRAALAGDVLDATAGEARVCGCEGRVRIGRELGRRPPPALPVGPAPQVWDGRFLVSSAAPGERVAPLAGFAARLPPQDRRRLHAVPAALRPACPAFLGPDGSARLADGRTRVAAALAPARLDFALGRIAREPGLTGGGRGRAEAVAGSAEAAPAGPQTRSRGLTP